MKRIRIIVLMGILSTLMACKSKSYLWGNSYEQPIVITGITEHYLGTDTLIRYAKTFTGHLMRVWDSIEMVDKTIIIDTLGKKEYPANTYFAHITCIKQGIKDPNPNLVRYEVVLEHTESKEKTSALKLECEELMFFSFNFNKYPPVKAWEGMYGLFSAIAPVDRVLHQKQPLRSERTKTYLLRTMRFGTSSFSKVQQDYLVRLINNIFIKGQSGYPSFHKERNQAMVDYVTYAAMVDGRMGVPLGKADYVLDFEFLQDTLANRIMLNYTLERGQENGEEEKGSVSFSRDKFMEGETLESNYALSKHFFGLIRSLDPLHLREDEVKEQN